MARSQNLLAKISVILVGCSLLFAVGCGGSGPSVSGTVSFEDGTPLTSGTVLMTGDTVEGFGEIKPDGTYTIGTGDVGDGLPNGTYKISVKSYGEAGEDGMGVPLVAEKYTTPDTSGLTVEVNGPTVHPIKVGKAK